MRSFDFLVVVLLTIFSLLAVQGKAAAGGMDEELKGLGVGGLYFLSYQYGSEETGDFGEFRVNRAYVTLKKSLLPNLSSRVTIDAYQDETGDLKARVKYVYAHFGFGDFLYFSNLNVEFGQVHTPWLDFEEHINLYRMQGTMFMERVGIFNSGDFGFSLGGYFGGVMDDEYRTNVSAKYPGKYGSFAVGLYNGGGYHAEEANLNKVFQGRVTLRPAPDFISGLQLSLLNIYGKVNKSGDEEGKIADWITNAFMLSFEHRFMTLTAQYVIGEGNKSGSAANWDSYSFDVWDYAGFSLFGEWKLAKHWRIIGRYDHINPGIEELDDDFSRMIFGLGYDFGKGNILLLDYDWVDYDFPGFGDFERVQVTMQVGF